VRIRATGETGYLMRVPLVYPAIHANKR